MAAASWAGGARSSAGAALAVLVLASFVVVLDFAGSIILLPSIQADLGGALDEVTWVVAAFVLTFAALFLPSARLAERYGYRRVFLGGVGTFLVASLAAALSPTLGVLIAARVVQGAGAAMIEPAVRALITATTPEDRRPRAFDVQSGVFLLAAALGPVLPGALATVLSWRYLFWLNVLLGALILVGATRLLPEPRRSAPPSRPDVPGLVWGALALTGLFFAVIEGPRLGWASAPIVVALIASPAAVVLFLVTESRAAHPLVPLGLFRTRAFTVGNLARAATEFTSLGIFLPLSGFLQTRLGYSPLVAGLLLMSVIAGALATAPLAENLADRLPPRWLIAPGLVLVAAGIFWLAHLSPDTGWAFFIAPLAVAGAGIGALEGPTEGLTRGGISTGDPTGDADSAWRVSYTTYLLGIGSGVAVVSGVWQSGAGADPAGAVNRALLACAAVALAAAVTTAVLLPGGRMSRRTSLR